MSTPTPPLAEIAKAVREQDLDRARALATEALAYGAVHPALFNVQAMWFEKQGRDAEAVLLFERATELAPADTAVLNAMGLCLARLRRFDEALAAFDKAIALRPVYPLTHFRRGHTLWLAGKPLEAEASLKKALSLDPQLPEALSCLASILAERGDVEASASYARRALQKAPADTLATSVLAAADIAREAYTAAEARLRPLFGNQSLPVEARVMISGLLGDALLAQGRNQESYDVLASRNAFVQPQSNSGEYLSLERLRGLTDFLAGTAPSFWHGRDDDLPATERPERHIFLVGFPRSGTDLVAQLLSRHPAVAALRDVDPLSQAAATYVANREGLDRLSALDARGLSAARETYWRSVRGIASTNRGKVLIDSTPMNAMRLPIIARLFPSACVVEVMRDPRDTVASCFRELPRVQASFGRNPDPEEIAQLFDGVARIVSAAQDRMSLSLRRVRFEDLVSDVEGQLSAVCEFVGLSWEKNLFKRNGQQPGPNAREEDYRYLRERPGFWRAWAEHLAPAIPHLRPWIEQGGYA